jgi:hypothetical protein
MIVDHGYMHGIQYDRGWVLFMCNQCDRRAWMKVSTGKIQVESVGDPLALHRMRAEEGCVTEEVWREVQRERAERRIGGVS